MRRWAALRPFGRLVVDAVTLESEALLLALHGRAGRRSGAAGGGAGGADRARGPAGGRLMPVTQWSAGPAMSGTLYGVGVGPGDPELMTLKAARLIGAARVVAYPTLAGAPSFARAIAAGLIPAGCREIAMDVPMTVERAPAQAAYDRARPRSGSVLAAGAGRGLPVRGRSVLLRLVHVSLRPAGRAAPGRGGAGRQFADRRGGAGRAAAGGAQRGGDGAAGAAAGCRAGGADRAGRDAWRS